MDIKTAAQRCFLLIFATFCVTKCEIGSLKKFPFYSYKSQDDVNINKVIFTQRGYIQFLKYITDVPTITDFTFCVWLKSSNFTFSHPLLSYSRNEDERLIRVWISNEGKDVNMALRERAIFKVAINARENLWYHICPSWNSKRATWHVYLNGKLRDTGTKPKLQNLTIPSGGDLVVGQEYTDFDHGLDDGIEGDIFGFNMILSPIAPPKGNPKDQPDRRRQIYIPTDFSQFNSPPFQDTLVHPFTPNPQVDVPEVLGYFSAVPNRQPKGILDMLYHLLESKPAFRTKINAPYYTRRNQGFSAGPARRVYTVGFGNEIEAFQPQKTLGLMLVELGYHKCTLGMGAPIIDDKVLISWTKTPVKVFGGAILKSVKPFCKKH